MISFCVLLLGNRRPEQRAQNAVNQKSQQQYQAYSSNGAGRQLLDNPRPCRFQPVVEYQSHEGETYHAAKADDPVDVPKQFPVVPEPHPEKMDSGKADDILHHAGDSGSDKNGKKLYKMICSNLNNVGISSERFIQYLCEDICDYEDFSRFISTLTHMLS